MTPATPIRVAVVEDDRGFREMLATLLDSTPGFTCVAACEDAEQALRQIPRTKPDVVLVDLRLPAMPGDACIRALRKARLDTAFMVLTSFDDPGSVFPALQAGASGYLLKRTPPVQILEAIRELHDGGAPMTPLIARRVLESLHDVPGKETPQPLTPRERELLTLAARGAKYQDIAERLGISHGTVRTHFRNIYEKLHVHCLAEALRHIGLKPPGRGGSG